jgi:hypothetical protein
LLRGAVARGLIRTLSAAALAAPLGLSLSLSLLALLTRALSATLALSEHAPRRRDH